MERVIFLRQEDGDREKIILDDGNTDDKETHIATFTPTRLVQMRVKFSGILWENFKLEAILMTLCEFLLTSASLGKR